MVCIQKRLQKQMKTNDLLWIKLLALNKGNHLYQSAALPQVSLHLAFQFDNHQRSSPILTCAGTGCIQHMFGVNCYLVQGKVDQFPLTQQQMGLLRAVPEKWLVQARTRANQAWIRPKSWIRSLPPTPGWPNHRSALPPTCSAFPLPQANRMWPALPDAGSSWPALE